MNTRKTLVASVWLSSLCLSSLSFGAGESAQTGGSAAGTQENPVQQQEWGCPMMQGQHPMHKGGHRQWLMTLPQTTIEGRIQDVNVQETCMGEQRAMHLKVKSGDAEFNVHVGPTRYVNSHNFRFAIGDDLRISGAVIDTGTVKTIVAYTLEKDGVSLVLRDKNARPFWAPGSGGMGQQNRTSH